MSRQLFAFCLSLPLLVAHPRVKLRKAQFWRSSFVCPSVRLSFRLTPRSMTLDDLELLYDQILSEFRVI